MMFLRETWKLEFQIYMNLSTLFALRNPLLKSLNYLSSRSPLSYKKRVVWTLKQVAPGGNKNYFYMYVKIKSLQGAFLDKNIAHLGRNRTRTVQKLWWFIILPVINTSCFCVVFSHRKAPGACEEFRSKTSILFRSLCNNDESWLDRRHAGKLRAICKVI